MRISLTWFLHPLSSAGCCSYSGLRLHSSLPRWVLGQGSRQLQSLLLPCVINIAQSTNGLPYLYPHRVQLGIPTEIWKFWCNNDMFTTFQQISAENIHIKILTFLSPLIVKLASVSRRTTLLCLPVLAWLQRYSQRFWLQHKGRPCSEPQWYHDRTPCWPPLHSSMDLETQ